MMLQNCWKFPNRNAQTFGFVYHDTNGQNHGPVWKTQSFLLSEICTVILWQDCYGKGKLRKSYWCAVGRRFPIGSAYSYTVNKDCSYLCMWMTSNWLERNKTLIRCGKSSIKKSIWENQDLSLIMYTWDGLKDNVKLAKILLTVTEPCLNDESQRSELKNYHVRKIFVFPHGPTIWKVMLRNVWNDIVSWQTRRLNNSSKYLRHDRHFKEVELKSVGELSKVCSQIVLKCLYLARIGRLDILWSVNKLARWITKWTKACDNLKSFDILHPSHMWIQTVLLCG